ncbi:MAG: NADH-quinone oxidoreductase subunit NuoN [Alphaproteobacteria bacterium]
MITTYDFIAPVLPEITLAIAALIFLIYGVYKGDSSTRIISVGTMFALGLASFFVMIEKEPTVGYAFQGMLISDSFINLLQAISLWVTIAVLLGSYKYLKQDNIERFEYPILMLLSALGMLIMIAANDIMMLFVGLELQSFPIYIMCALRRDQAQAGESAMKYFVLGAISTIFILYGASFIYGYAGTTDFYGISVAFSEMSRLPAGLMLAFILLFAGIAFKISAVPFHMWTPDVYQGSPTLVTLFLSSAPKVAAIAMLVRVLYGPLGQFVEYWQPIVQTLAVLSMVLGVFTAVFQKQIKRLLAYSTISHMGFLLIGISCASTDGVQSTILYLIIYSVMIVGIFACLIHLRRHGHMPETIDDLKGLSQLNPSMAFAIAVLMFSLAGIPPLAGFFAKLSIFLAAVQAEMYTITIIGVLASVVAASYYLKIIKVMYFDAPVGGKAAMKYDQNGAFQTSTVIAAATVANILFFLVPDYVMTHTASATKVLLALAQ